MSEQVEVDFPAAATSPDQILGGWPDDVPIRGEVFGPEHLEDHARRLASASGKVQFDYRVPDLLQRFRHIRRDLQEANSRLARMAQQQNVLSGGADWLLDNSYIVMEN